MKKSVMFRKRRKSQVKIEQKIKRVKLFSLGKVQT